MPFFGSKNIDIKLVGPNLVAAFHRAQPELVWRFDLERNHSFTIALQGDEGDWELGITSAKGEFYPIVHFAAREDAEEALNAVQKMLMSKRRSKLWVALKIFLLVVVAVICLVAAGVELFFHSPVFSTQIPPAALATMHGPAAVSAPAPAPAAPPEALPSGIPVPADEVLKPPR